MNLFKRKKQTLPQEENETGLYRITLKGVIFLALGGYTAEVSEEKSKEKTENVISHLKEFMINNKSGLLCVDGELIFVPVEFFEKSEKS